MAYEKELKIFNDYIHENNLKYSEQRQNVLEIFLETEKHLTAEELYKIVKKSYPKIGFATIYRTLKLLCECGICREIRFEDRMVRYEHLYGHCHHDHIICIKCGRCVEVFEPKIEKLQDILVKKYSFKPIRHRMEIFGICKECK